MRTPLFLAMARAKQDPRVPAELRFSGILSFQWLNENRPFSFWHPMLSAQPSGHMAIDAIVSRVLRESGPVSGQAIAKVRKKVAPSIYDHSAQLTRYERDHIAPLLRPARIWEQSLYERGKRCQFDAAVIAIEPAKRKPCRWCMKPVFYKESWVDGAGTVRCNEPDCRRMDYLQNIPQSKGGIDLTPAQRKALNWEARPQQKAINYLLLRTKELQRASRANHVVR